MGMRKYKLALVGNPNTGKTSLFNKLTGLHKKIGNYPGITVNRVAGFFTLDNGTEIELIDLPGTYSLHPNSKDEEVVLKELLLNREGIEGIILVADVNNLKKNMILLTELQDLGYPVMLAINMCDEMKRKGIEIDVNKLEELLQIPVMLISAKKAKADGQRHGKGKIHQFKQRIPEMFDKKGRKYFENYGLTSLNLDFIPDKIKKDEIYKNWILYTEQDKLKRDIREKYPYIFELPFDKTAVKKLLQKEIIKRYKDINNILSQTYRIDKSKATGFTERIDRILLHKFWGLFIFILIMFTVFQSIFSLASIPMEWIDGVFAHFNAYLKNVLPANDLTALLTDGILAGIAGVVIFIPQIAILFLFIALLEEMGYMSRIVYLMDKIMQPFGLSGKSVVPLLSGTACAVPAIMGARTIENAKERLITILTTPFMTCSARLPVYTIIIALIIPETKVWGVINLQGLALFGLYFLGFASALISAWLLSKVIKSSYKRYFILEMPEYKLPIPKNIYITLIDNLKAFVFGAGKIIVAFSIIIWFLATHGPEKFDKPGSDIQTSQNKEMTPKDLSAYKLENSYLGIMGKTIEPVIRPLGYDWKIGIALLTSFAAREVFVSTLSTIYSVGDTGDEQLLKDRMKKERNMFTGQPTFTFAVGISLLLFYAFAMQCFSTLATIKNETKSWKWPVIVFIYMTGIAYITAFIAYQTLK
jgi:ferrous iron transport protein B